MGETEYSYQTQIRWLRLRRGVVQSEGLPDLDVSTPPEFNGESGFWTPEHLYVAAAESCLMATFLAIAEKSGLTVLGYNSSARGRLETVPASGLRFGEVEILPVVELDENSSAERAERVMERAAKGCLIANSISAPVRVTSRFLLKEKESASVRFDSHHIII